MSYTFESALAFSCNKLLFRKNEKQGSGKKKIKEEGFAYQGIYQELACYLTPTHQIHIHKINLKSKMITYKKRKLRKVQHNK
jgi:hypothetical protein